MTNKGAGKNPTYEQVACALPGGPRAALDELMDFFRGLRLSPRWYAAGAMSIKYLGKIILRFTVSFGRVDVFFTLADPLDLDGVLETLPDEYREFYFEHLRRCTRCNPRHGSGRRMTILGRAEEVCAEPEIRITDLTRDQARRLMFLASVRRENILMRKNLRQAGLA